MAEPLMPKATAVWLVENTSLTFDQIAAFCELHRLEVQGIADGEVAVGIRGLDPIAAGQLSREEIERCESDSKERLTMSVRAAKVPQRARRARYTPVSKRQDRPNAISWLLKNYPDLSDAQVGKLLGTTKTTINSVRERTHWNTPNITPQDPILLGICTEAELLDAVRKAEARVARAAERAEREARRAAKAKEAEEKAAAEEAQRAEAAEAPAQETMPAAEASTQGDASPAESAPPAPVETEHAPTQTPSTGDVTHPSEHASIQSPAVSPAHGADAPSESPSDDPSPAEPERKPDAEVDPS